MKEKIKELQLEENHKRGKTPNKFSGLFNQRSIYTICVVKKFKPCEVTITTIEPSQCRPHNPVKGPMHVDPNHCMVCLGKKSYMRRKSKCDFKE